MIGSELIDRIALTAQHHIAEGYSESQAVDMAIARHSKEIQDELRSRSGLGQDVTDQSLLQQAQADVSSISKVVSPWLWILSIGGFFMGIVSKYEISKMYGSYKRMKAQLR